MFNRPVSLAVTALIVLGCLAAPGDVPAAPRQASAAAAMPRAAVPAGSVPAATTERKALAPPASPPVDAPASAGQAINAGLSDDGDDGEAATADGVAVARAPTASANPAHTATHGFLLVVVPGPTPLRC